MKLYRGTIENGKSKTGIVRDELFLYDDLGETSGIGNLHITRVKDLVEIHDSEVSRDTTMKLNPVEIRRIYTFPNDNEVTLRKVTEVTVRPSGTHRLKTEDGMLHIIPVGWIHIAIDAEDWTF